MDDELEQKRKEKVENFKISFDDSVILKSSETVENTINNTKNSINNNISQELSSEENTVSFIKNNTNNVVSESKLDDESNDILNSYSGTDVLKASEPNKKDLRRAKKADKIRRKKKAKKNRTIFRMIWIAMILFVSVVLGKYIMVGVNDMLAVGREEEKSVEVTIPKNADINQVADILYDNHIINNKDFFKLYATVTKSTTGFTQGTFDVYTNKDYQALINYMQSDMNRTDVVTIQFTEGMSIQEYAKLLDTNGVCSAEDFLEKCNSTDFDEDYEFINSISNSKDRYYKLEGYLFPDTYDFYVGEDSNTVIRKFLANYRRKLYLTKSRVEGFEKKVTIEERAKAIGMSMEDVITMASLIQAEAANAEDMYIISSILHNRLETLKTDGMNELGEGGLDCLQLDSTVFYPYKSENQVPATLRKNYVSAYNTYNNKGLPHGPICNPGIEAIEAAVTPADTDYYYFCHKSATEDSPSIAYYAETNSKHLENLREAGLLD